MTEFELENDESSSEFKRKQQKRKEGTSTLAHKEGVKIWKQMMKQRVLDQKKRRKQLYDASKK